MVSWVPGCRALDVLGELDPCARAHVDHRPVRVLGVPDGDQCLAGPDFDAVAVGAAVGGLPPVYLGHVTYCDTPITLREQPMTRPTRSVTNSLQSAHAGHGAHCVSISTPSVGCDMPSVDLMPHPPADAGHAQSGRRRRDRRGRRLDLTAPRDLPALHKSSGDWL